MTSKEQYEAWDKQGFNGDENINETIKELCARHKVNVIFETGTRYGNTTKRLAAHAVTITCELDKLNFEIAKQNLINKETGKEIAICFNCDSIALLNTNLTMQRNKSVLLYLDAHGPQGTPLLGELQAVIDSGIKPVIIIHDFVNPERPEFGFDTYNGQPYTFEWIKPYIDKIYGVENYAISYNGVAAGAMRGVIYIEPLTFNERLEIVSEKIVNEAADLSQLAEPVEAPKKRGRKKKNENTDGTQIGD